QTGIELKRIAVNVSARQLRDGNFIKRVQRILTETGLDPQRLELELTESVLMQQGDALSTFQALIDMGVALTIDDFGTGYSSLSYLRTFPVRRLKIDRSFVRDLAGDSSNVAIVDAIITLAHGLNLEVVAEGVESARQLNLLR